MHGNRELHHTEVRAKMPTGTSHRVDQEVADLLGQRRKLRSVDPLEIGRAVD
jgi:hypothetical protein